MHDYAANSDSSKWTTSQVRVYLSLDPTYVRQLADRGELGDVELTPYGRLYDPAGVQAYKERKAKQPAR